MQMFLNSASTIHWCPLLCKYLLAYQSMDQHETSYQFPGIVGAGKCTIIRLFPQSTGGGGRLLKGHFVLKNKSSIFEILIVKVLAPAALVLGLLKHLELKWRMEEG